MKNKLTILFFSFLLISLLMLSIQKVNATNEPFSSLIDADVNINHYFSQHRDIFAKGLWWKYYSQLNVGYFYRTSEDLITWSEKVSVFDSWGDVGGMSVAYDGNNFHVVITNGTAYADEYIAYRMGTANSDGSIDWITEWQRIATGVDPTTWVYHPNIFLDKDNKPWVYYSKWWGNSIGYVDHSIYSNGTWQSPVGGLVDSYAEGNKDDHFSIGTTSTAVGQSFTCSSKQILTSVKFYLTKSEAEGTVTAQIYTHSGTYGTNSVPTGSALATSDALNVSDFTQYPTFSLVTFTFSGVNKITLSAYTYYCLSLNGTGITVSTIGAGMDVSSPNHSGNWFYYAGSWGSVSTRDSIFYVYGKVFPSKLSDTTSNEPVIGNMVSYDDGTVQWIYAPYSYNLTSYLFNNTNFISSFVTPMRADWTVYSTICKVDENRIFQSGIDWPTQRPAFIEFNATHFIRLIPDLFGLYTDVSLVFKSDENLLIIFGTTGPPWYTDIQFKFYNLTSNELDSTSYTLIADAIKGETIMGTEKLCVASIEGNSKFLITYVSDEKLWSTYFCWYEYFSNYVETWRGTIRNPFWYFVEFWLGKWKTLLPLGPPPLEAFILGVSAMLGISTLASGMLMSSFFVCLGMICTALLKRGSLKDRSLSSAVVGMALLIVFTIIGWVNVWITLVIVILAFVFLARRRH